METTVQRGRIFSKSLRVGSREESGGRMRRMGGKGLTKGQTEWWEVLGLGRACNLKNPGYPVPAAAPSRENLSSPHQPSAAPRRAVWGTAVLGPTRQCPGF
jgi:hypothetical protein